MMFSRRCWKRFRAYPKTSSGGIAGCGMGVSPMSSHGQDARATMVK